MVIGRIREKQIIVVHIVSLRNYIHAYLRDVFSDIESKTLDLFSYTVIRDLDNLAGYVVIRNPDPAPILMAPISPHGLRRREIIILR